MIEVRKCIWLIGKEDENHPDLPEVKPGYYFQDETENIFGNGPYSTAEQADKALERYCKEYLGWRPVE